MRTATGVAINHITLPDKSEGVYKGGYFSLVRGDHFSCCGSEGPPPAAGICRQAVLQDARVHALASVRYCLNPSLNPTRRSGMQAICVWGVPK